MVSLRVSSTGHVLQSLPFHLFSYLLKAVGSSAIFSWFSHFGIRNAVIILVILLTATLLEYFLFFGRGQSTSSNIFSRLHTGIQPGRVPL